MTNLANSHRCFASCGLTNTKGVPTKLTNWRLIPHIGFTVVGLAPASAFGSYAPTLVAGFGFEKLRSNALSSVGFWILMFLNLFWGWAA